MSTSSEIRAAAWSQLLEVTGEDVDFAAVAPDEGGSFALTIQAVITDMGEAIRYLDDREIVVNRLRLRATPADVPGANERSVFRWGGVIFAVEQIEHRDAYHTFILIDDKNKTIGRDTIGGSGGVA